LRRRCHCVHFARHRGAAARETRDTIGRAQPDQRHHGHRDAEQRQRPQPNAEHERAHEIDRDHDRQHRSRKQPDQVAAGAAHLGLLGEEIHGISQSLAALAASRAFGAAKSKK